MKKKTVYVCSDCGYETAKWMGKCPQCGQWNTLEEMTIREEKPGSLAPKNKLAVQPIPVCDIDLHSDKRVLTGISELDRVLGGGLVVGSLVLVAGEPGIGKSTLLLQVCRNLAEKQTVLYVTGEESLAQIRMRASRIGAMCPGLLILPETDLEAIFQAADRLSPQTLIVDSIQTIQSDTSQSMPGSVSQVRESTLRLMQYAKQQGVSTFLVGHVNKDGGIAGPKVLEHMVDTVLYFEGERYAAHRMLRAAKNRFGSTNEIGMFEMVQSGLQEVTNPSAALIAGRPEGASGSCIVCTLEGTRPLLAEVQALVAKTAYGAARRMAAGIDYNRAVLLLAILEKRAGLLLSNYDSYINVVGGLRIDEPAADLAAAIAVASSYLEQPVDPHTAVFGELGLSGEIRAVSGPSQRLREISRLGFSRCILPAAGCEDMEVPEGLEILPVRDIREAIRGAFRQSKPNSADQE